MSKTYNDLVDLIAEQALWKHEENLPHNPTKGIYRGEILVIAQPTGGFKAANPRFDEYAVYSPTKGGYKYSGNSASFKGRGGLYPDFVPYSPLHEKTSFVDSRVAHMVASFD